MYQLIILDADRQQAFVKRTRHEGNVVYVESLWVDYKDLQAHHKLDLTKLYDFYDGLPER